MSTPRACSVDKSAPSNRPDPSTLSIVARRHFSNGSHMQIAGGVVIPVHTRAPGQDGYRTPTGEDYENHARQYLKNKANRPSNISGSYFAFDGSENDTSNTTAGRRNVRIQSPPASGCGTPRASINRSRLSLSAVGEKLIENLEWKVRIRHFTWTFFTMTMATGGIANVLFAGMHSLMSGNDPRKVAETDSKASTFPLQRNRYYWHNLLSLQRRFVSHQHSVHKPSLLVLPRNLQGQLVAPYRIPVHACGCCLVWHHSHQHITVWPA